MSACSFVKSAVNEEAPLITEEGRREAREDVEIIDNSLRFVNDLLRNMLDMHRATNKQLNVNLVPTDVLLDVLEPVQAMLPQREGKLKVLVECPSGLMVLTDRLRLKQICLNLARNSVKFVDEGFIRLTASVIKGQVNIYVEDSGPGIPAEKRTTIFSKFQESLDSLSQGTGIGLFLCQNLVSLMEGEIHLDDEYHSGITDHPGTRFVVNLKREAIDPQSLHDINSYSGGDMGETHLLEDDESCALHLPENLSVLFVDDDPILRKLFSRTVRTVAPGWIIREASNGETALRLVNEDTFDLIFMDMYMASVEKQLLGTETVRELRAQGVTCRICGLSANDKETEFLEAGANAFTFKPFPCEARALTQELIRVLYLDKSDEQFPS
jgi:CheY-like chemotaxis protein